jgi:N-acetylmuramoyl-L-alanine amidase
MTGMSRNGIPRLSPSLSGAALAAALLVSFSPASSRMAWAEGPPAIPNLVAANAPRVIFAGAPLPFASPALAPYRDPIDGALCVAPTSLAPLGVTSIIDAKMNKATFASADGSVSVTVDLRTPPEGFEGRAGVFVPAMEVIEGLGGKCEWYPGTNTMMARAVLTSVEMLGGQLRIKATLPVTPTITDQRDGRRVIVDFGSAEIGSLPHVLNLQSPLVNQARVGQFQPDTARLVLEMKQPYAFSVLGGKPSLQMILNPATPPAAAPTPISIAIGVPAAPSGARAHKVKAPPPMSIVSGVTFRRVSNDQAQFLISADRAPTIRAALSKGRLTLDLLNATLAAKASEIGAYDHPFLKGVQLLTISPAAAQLVVDLTRAVVYTIRPNDKGLVELDLSLPRGAVGKLSGKTIVVDPGHGGHDSGAPGVNGTVEKNVNLAIATQLAETLRDAGANVILTRSTDYFIPVDDRPIIANRAGADFFVSVHSDSADHNHSTNGSTIYYHYSQPSCRTLAQCIADRMADIGDIHSKGIGSDGIRFPGAGFGVLRGSQMVAVLVECGYMTNSGDVQKLNSPATQRKVADAIVSGLRDYIEGNPRLDTRNVNPQPDSALTNLPTAAPVAPANPDATDSTAPTDPTAPDAAPATPPTTN